MTKEELLKKLVLYKADPHFATFKELQNLVGKLEDISTAKKESNKLELPGVNLITIKGADGHTPTEEELIAIIEPLIPEVEDGHTPTDEELIALIKPLIPKVENGKTPTVSELLSLIKPLIPKVKDGETPTDSRLISLITPLISKLTPEVTGEEIVNKVNALHTDDEKLKIDASHIKNLPKAVSSEVKRLHRGGQKITTKDEGTTLTAETTSYNFVGSGVSATASGNEVTVTITSGAGGSWLTPTGTVDGVNTTFTVASEPTMVMVDGTAKAPGFGYTYAALTIEMVIPPNQWIRYM